MAFVKQLHVKTVIPTSAQMALYAVQVETNLAKSQSNALLTAWTLAGALTYSHSQLHLSAVMAYVQLIHVSVLLEIFVL